MSCEACGESMWLECDSEWVACEVCGFTTHSYCDPWHYREDGGQVHDECQPTKINPTFPRSEPAGEVRSQQQQGR